MGEAAYINALKEDLLLDLPLVWGRRVSSIFIGGGTPSLFSGEAIHQLIADLRSCLIFYPSIEITLEANPGSADESRFKAYRQAGINRLSLGIQSFDDNLLKTLGRVHNKKQALSAYDKARKAGFDNINLDLMYGLPGQDLQQAMTDIRLAIELQPEHLSHYQLSIEPNTAFNHQIPEGMPDDELSWQMQIKSQNLLAQAGFEQYEISGYARTGRQCRHNLNYWQFGDYLGLGAGAHGKITLPAENRVIRRSRCRQPEDYLKRQDTQRISGNHELNNQDLIFEYMLNALRLVSGFDQELFTERCGMPLSYLEKPIQKAIRLGLLKRDKTRIIPTRRGQRFNNDLQAMFLDLDIPV